MKLNFKGFSDSSLCDRCRYSHITITSTGMREVRCQKLMNHTIAAPNIVKCNNYSQIGQPLQYEMEDQAWILEVSKGKIMGFVQPKKKD